MITITVRGIPAPQGSKRHVGNGRMVESSRAVGPWREAVRAETQRIVTALPPDQRDGYWDAPAHAGPVAVQIDFYLPRPKSAPKRVTLPATRPDLDKLARAVLDGLVDGGALADDGQVTCLNLTKSFADDLTPAGAQIWISEDVKT